MTLVTLIVLLAVIGVVIAMVPAMDYRIRNMLVIISGVAVILWLLQLANIVHI